MTTKQYDAYSDLITFTRASTGTALRHVGYGAELVTNGTFDTDSDWTLASAWSISGGVLTGTATGGVVEAATQLVSGLEVGNVYKISFDISDVSNLEGNDAFVSFGSELAATPLTSAGAYEYFVVAQGAESIFSVRFSSVSEASDSLTIDNVSVKEVIFDRATDPLVLFNHPTNVPRIEYDANGNRRGLLIEEARTNLLTYSEAIVGAGWSIGSATVTADQVVAPDGNTTADEVNLSSGGFVYNTVTVLASTTYTASWYIKAGTATAWVWGFYDQTNAAWVDRQEYNITDGEDVGNGWYRFSVQITTPVGCTSLRVYPIREQAGGGIVAGATGTSFVWGAQLEAGSFPTSYISTSGAAASRSADVASIPTSAFGYNQKAGTVVCEFEYQYAIGGGFVRTWEIAGNSADRINLYTSNSSGRLNFAAVENNIIQVAFNNLAEFNAFRDLNTAVAFSNNDFAAVVDGILKGTSTSGSITNPSVPRDKFSIGSNFTTGNQLNGHIKSIQYYPRRLTNAQLVELTS